MKKSKIVLISLMVLSFVIVGISFAFLGDVIPTHFGIDGKPDQYGSKYFILIFPLISALVGVSMLLVCKYAKVSDNYQKYLLLTGNIVEGLFVALTLFFVVYASMYNEGKEFNTSKVIMPIMGVMFIVMGNFMPKIEKNRTLGFKIYWSMYNEVTWQKTHRFTGFVAVIVGALTIILGLFFEDMVNFIILMSLIGVLIISTTIASYKYYKEEKAKEEKN